MDIGIIGSGHVGSALAGRRTELGYRVLIANSRGPASLATRAAEIGATAATVKQAARARDILILAVPEKSVWQLPGDIFATTTAIIVDAGNYYPCRDSRIPESNSAFPESAWVARLLGRPVIKAMRVCIRHLP
jgi:predicted dinucleotide-binding enzyme